MTKHSTASARHETDTVAAPDDPRRPLHSNIDESRLGGLVAIPLWLVDNLRRVQATRWQG